MIGFVHDLIVEHVLDDQTLEERGETRVYLDPDAMPIGTAAQEIDVSDYATRPIGYEIGGGVQLRHTINVALEVQHGDAAASRRLRDLILTEIMLRFVGSGRAAIGGADDPVTRQIVDDVAVRIDYSRPLPVSDTHETATLVFDVDTTLDG